MLPTTGQNQIGYFYWTPTFADARITPYIAAFRVKDNQCAEQSYGYRIFVDTCNNLAIKKNNKRLRVKVYPNPTQSNMTISLEVDKTQDYKITLYDMVGRLVKDDIYNGELANGKHSLELDLSSQASGQYQLEIVSENGNLVLPVIKQ